MSAERIDPPEELLSAYLDGEATPDERARVEAQLATSEEWRDVLEELRSTRALLLASPVREAPTGFWDSLLHPDIAPPLPTEPVRSIESAPSRRRSRAIAWIAGAAAAAAIAVVVLVPGQSRVKPAVATLVSRHAVRSSVTEDPVSQLAPVSKPVQLGR
ncbi:MAG TPA: zf-HC2 domain-containing protein [Acidimicrobiia bacterium]|jgi:anti-sigma factor RsiW